MTNNAERLLEIIKELDTLVAQLLVDGQTGYATDIGRLISELYWVYHDMTEYD